MRFFFVFSMQFLNQKISSPTISAPIKASQYINYVLNQNYTNQNFTDFHARVKDRNTYSMTYSVTYYTFVQNFSTTFYLVYKAEF